MDDLLTDGTGAARVVDGAAQGRERSRQSVMVGRRSAARSLDDGGTDRFRPERRSEIQFVALSHKRLGGPSYGSG